MDEYPVGAFSYLITYVSWTSSRTIYCCELFIINNIQTSQWRDEVWEITKNPSSDFSISRTIEVGVERSGAWKGEVDTRGGPATRGQWG